MADSKPKRPRRSYSEELKAGAVRLVLDEGKTVGAAARDLDLTESSLRNWVEQARADRGTGKPGVRFVVGWAVSAVNDRHSRSKPSAWRLDADGITCSMSRRGDCYDNAVMEAFFSSLKSEPADRFDSCGDAKMELVDYIEVFCNQRRRHSTIGYVSPAAFERLALRCDERSPNVEQVESGRMLPSRADR